jgi:tetratricopeptide (TPR) repeat protein
MNPVFRGSIALACAIFIPAVAANAAAIELDSADRRKYDEASDLIHTWPGSGDRLQRAFAILVDLAQRNPRNAYPLAGLAEIKYRLFGNDQGAAGEVVELAGRAVKLDPQNADAQVIYAKIMLDQGQVDIAARAADQAIRLAPEKPEAMFQKASVARHAWRYDEAEGWYRKSIDRLSHKQRKSNVYLHMAQMFDKKEAKTPADIAKATDAFVNAAELTDDSIPILNAAAVFLKNSTERYDQAIGYLSKALRVSDYSLGRSNLGLAQFYKWGHATLHPEKYRNAKDKPWDPEKITAMTGVTKEFAFAMNPAVDGTPYATIAMLQRNMIKDIDVFPENCECPDNALIASAHGNHLDVVQMLVARGANVNAADLKYGSTALFHAVRYQNLEMARYLVDQGARINLEDKHGKLLVEYAVMDAKPDDARVLKLLLEKGGDADAVTRTGSPLVAVAVVQGKPAALELLLRQYKADPNARMAGERGDPVLALAAANSHADGTRMMKMLLEAGANPWVKYGGGDVIDSLSGSKEAYTVAGDLPPQIKAANAGILRAIDANIAMLQEARRGVPKPARF